jgi:hypothetical protein
VSTGFIPPTRRGRADLCGATARFETNSANPAAPTWINYAGGDTRRRIALLPVP